jgi:hypothetical protein
MRVVPTYSQDERQTPLHSGEPSPSAAAVTATYALSFATTSSGKVILVSNHPHHHPPTAQLAEPLTIDEEIELMTKPGKLHPSIPTHWQESLQLTEAEYNALAARPLTPGFSPMPSPRYDDGFEFESDSYCTDMPGGGDHPSGVPWQESGVDASTNAPARVSSHESPRRSRHSTS